MSTENFSKKSDTQLIIDSTDFVEEDKKRTQKVDINNLIERVCSRCDKKTTEK